MSTYNSLGDPEYDRQIEAYERASTGENQLDPREVNPSFDAWQMQMRAGQRDAALARGDQESADRWNDLIRSTELRVAAERTDPEIGS